MTNAAASPATIAANLRWFAVVYAVALVAIGVAVAIAANYGIELPTTGAAIGAYAGVCVASAQRFALRRAFNWSSADRHKLALGYTAIAVVVECGLFAAAARVDPTAGAQLIDAWRAAPQLLIAFAAIALTIHYGMARLMLRFIANRGEKQ